MARSSPGGGEPNLPVGLYAVGECSASACTAPTARHQLVARPAAFGKAAGNHIIANHSKGAYKPPAGRCAADRSLERLNWLENANDGEYAQSIANDIRASMQAHAGVFRTQASMDEGVRKIAELRERVNGLGLKDHSRVFNMARREALEVENLIEAAQATMVSAAARHECRGAHTVVDYEKPADDPQAPLGRDDAHWMKHTLWHKDGNQLSYKPVRLQPLTVESVPPKVRTF